jgi:hypothetical protein
VKYWTLRIGITLIVIGVFFLSPIADFLPIDLLPRLVSSIGLGEPQASPNVAYLRVVPKETFPVIETSLIVIGALFVSISLFGKSKK